jgi:hypothetical protein
MGEFVLLYRFTPEMSAQALASPERARQSMAKWTSWLEGMKQAGQLLDSGRPLEAAGKVVRGRTFTDGPYAESKELVGGYSLIEARDLDEAARIAQGCPILEGGGAVEVRPVRPMPR